MTTASTISSNASRCGRVGVSSGSFLTASLANRITATQMGRIFMSADDAEFRPQPGLMDVPDLLDTMRLTGLAVDVAVTGTPRRPLPAGAELAAYRVVQEALTNTARHGGPDVRARVEFAWSPTGLAIDVLDDGRGAAASPATRGSGQGLLGLHERVDLFGGTVEAGPVVGGGFRVRATLPYVET